MTGDHAPDTSRRPGFRIAFRSPKLNKHPGIYMRIFGKWYRIVRWTT